MPVAGWRGFFVCVLPLLLLIKTIYFQNHENFFRKYLQVQILYVTLHPRLRNKPNTATSGAVVQLVRIRACHARGRGFEPLPHRQVPLMKNEGHLSYIGICGSAGSQLLRPEFVGDNVKWAMGKIPGQGGTGFKNIHFCP